MGRSLMGALIGVWFTSLLGAIAFTVAGVALARSGLLDAFFPPLRPAVPPEPAPASEPREPRAREAAEPRATSVPPPSIPSVRPPPSTPSVKPPPAPPSVPIASIVTPASTPLAATIEELAIASGKIESLTTDLLAAKAETTAARDKERIAEASRATLETQLTKLREEVTKQAVERTNAESRVAELVDRLASASEQASSLRHRVNTLEAQNRQGHGDLRGRSSIPPRRSSRPIPTVTVPERLYDASIQTVRHPSGSRPAVAPNATESQATRALVDRLTAENKALRAHALLNAADKRKITPSPGELDLDRLRRLLERMASVDHLTAAAITDEVGAVVLGSGEHADGLAAFGAYMADAATRGELLLPLKGVDELSVRDGSGNVFAARVVARGASELSLVVLTQGEGALREVRRIVQETDTK